MRQANLATNVEWIEIHSIYIYINNREMKNESGFSLAMASLPFGTFDISNYSWHGRNQEQCQGFEIGTEAFETLKGVQLSSFTSLLAYWR